MVCGSGLATRVRRKPTSGFEPQTPSLRVIAGVAASPFEGRKPPENALLLTLADSRDSGPRKSRPRNRPGKFDERPTGGGLRRSRRSLRTHLSPTSSRGRAPSHPSTPPAAHRGILMWVDRPSPRAAPGRRSDHAPRGTTPSRPAGTDPAAPSRRGPDRHRHVAGHQVLLDAFGAAG